LSNPGHSWKPDTGSLVAGRRRSRRPDWTWRRLNRRLGGPSVPGLPVRGHPARQRPMFRECRGTKNGSLQASWRDCENRSRFIRTRWPGTSGAYTTQPVATSGVGIRPCSRPGSIQPRIDAARSAAHRRPKPDRAIRSHGSPSDFMRCDQIIPRRNAGTRLFLTSLKISRLVALQPVA
jgi:hypothetical protein